MQRVLVTGGSGFVGRHLIAEILSRYPDVETTSLSRSEGIISGLQMYCPSRQPKIVMADIRDAEATRYALRGVDTLIHLAAMKRVDLSEQEPFEATSINVIGSMNVLNAFTGDTFILQSTDKAVEPCNCYGATKLIAENLVKDHAKKQTNGTRYMIIRSGNIVDSTGSVTDIWKQQIRDRNEITVTDMDMLRFYISIDQLIRLHILVIERGENGKIYVTPRGDPKPLSQLVHEVIERYGNALTAVRFIGSRPGERMVEKMYVPGESDVIVGFEYPEADPSIEVFSREEARV